MIAQRLGSYRTLVEAIAAAPADEPFVTVWKPDEVARQPAVTFGELAARAASYAELYRDHGLRPRDTVVLILPQDIELMAAFVGALASGIIPTILAYPTFKVDPEKYLHGLQGITRNLSARLVVLDRDFPAELASCVHGMATAWLDSSAVRASCATWARPEPDDVALLQHSSGTTGLQKGVALSHRSVLSQLAALAEVLALSSTDRIASWLPLYHDMGLIACFVLPLVAHIPVVMQSPTDWVLSPGSFLRLISDHRCTLCWLPNFAFQFLARRVRQDDREGLELSSLRAAISCSEPVRSQSMKEFLDAYRPHGLKPGALQTSYAMAETVFAVTQSVPEGDVGAKTIFADRDLLTGHGRVACVPAEHSCAIALVSSGRCLPGACVRVVDQAGGDLSDGAVGEILVRGDSLFSEYYNRPDLTDQALRAGWYRTADRGFLLGGEVFVLGRKDDLIIVGGRNLSPQAIEEAAAGHPDVRDGRVVAFGLLNRDLGTQDLVIVAEVVSEDRLARRTQIQSDVRQRVLGEIGVSPRHVHLVPPKWIVKSTSGKPARSTNREKLLREHPHLDAKDAP